MHINTDQLRERPESIWNSVSLARATRTVTCMVWLRIANLFAEGRTPWSNRSWTWDQGRRQPEIRRTAACRPANYFDATAAPPTPGCCPAFRQRRPPTEYRNWHSSTSRCMRIFSKSASSVIATGTVVCKVWARTANLVSECRKPWPKRLLRRHTSTTNTRMLPSVPTTKTIHSTTTLVYVNQLIFDSDELAVVPSRFQSFVFSELFSLANDTVFVAFILACNAHKVAYFVSAATECFVSRRVWWICITFFYWSHRAFSALCGLSHSRPMVSCILWNNK